jgi:CRP/FNR family cyclic AMP-dependent transcriptional regulator
MRTSNPGLRELPLFADASRSELDLIGRRLTLLTLPAGTVLMREGAPGEEFLILVQGEAEVSQGGKVIATVGRGDTVGEMALLDESGRGRRNASVKAVTNVDLYVGSRAEFRQIIDVAPSVAEKVHEMASSRGQVAA